MRQLDWWGPPRSIDRIRSDAQSTAAWKVLRRLIRLANEILVHEHAPEGALTSIGMQKAMHDMTQAVYANAGIPQQAFLSPKDHAEMTRLLGGGAQGRAAAKAANFAVAYGAGPRQLSRLLTPYAKSDAEATLEVYKRRAAAVSGHSYGIAFDVDGSTVSKPTGKGKVDGE